jgi:hypothetical protein
MTNRRDFLKEAAAATGVVFAGRSLLERSRRAQNGGRSKRRQVTVG